MRKIRFATQVTILFIKRFGLIIVVGIFAGGILFSLLGKFTPLMTGLFREERIGVVGRFTTDKLDKIPLPILAKISYGLTALDSENTVRPGIAQSWEEKDEGRIWLFTLRDNLRWQDNTPVRSSDFSYQIDGVTLIYPDDKHLEFQLTEPLSPFPVFVSRPYFKKGLLGVGEWKLKRMVSSAGNIKQLVLEELKTGKLESYRFYPTEEGIITAFKLGEIDTILEISDPRKLSEWPRISIKTINHQDRFTGIFLNTEDKFLSDKSVRQALAYGVKKQDFRNGVRALSPISPGSWAYNPLVKTYDYDEKRAKELLKTTKESSINLVTIPSLLPMAEKIAKDWEEIGVKTIVQVGTGVPDNFQALLITQIIPPDPDQYSMWHSLGREANITRYKNARIDKLLEDGRRTLNQEERKKIYLDFQRFLVEDLPVIFLSHPKSYQISRK